MAQTFAQLKQMVATARNYGPTFEAIMADRGATHVIELRKAREPHPPHHMVVDASEAVLRQMPLFKPAGRWWYAATTGPHHFWFEDEEDLILCKMSFKTKQEEKLVPFQTSYHGWHWENEWEFEDSLDDEHS